MRINHDSAIVELVHLILLIRRRRPGLRLLLTRQHARQFAVEVRHARDVDAGRLRELLHGRDATADDFADAGIL